VVFVLLTVMAGVGFATSRNLQRELATGGDARQGARAACAADSGLAWFLALAARDAGLQSWLAAPGSDAGEGRLLAHREEPLAGTGDSALQQSFELRIRHLGALPRPEGAPGAAEGVADQLWQVTATGRSAVKGQGQLGFSQNRELLVAVPTAPATDPPPDPSGRDAPPGGLRILAWRPGW
jgi:hypothetical protein